MLYGLISLGFLLFTSLPRAWSHGTIVFLLPLFALSILLLLPYAHLTPRVRHHTLIGLSIFVV